MQKRISLDQIRANPDQPRKLFEQDSLQDLANSIRVNGLMQPITVVKRDDHYMIVAGERRWRAHQLLEEAGHLASPDMLCLVRKMDETEIAINAIVENLVRQDVTPLEEANAYQAMIDQGFTVEDLATRLGVSQPFRIRERLALLRLNETSKQLFASGNLNAASAYEVAKLDEEDQNDFVRRISTGKLPTIGALRAAVAAKTDTEIQESFLAAEEINEADIEEVSAMERKVFQICNMISSGFRDGQCIIAARISPDKSATLAEKLSLASKAVSAMARELEAANAQVDILTDQPA